MIYYFLYRDVKLQKYSSLPKSAFRRLTLSLKQSEIWPAIYGPSNKTFIIILQYEMPATLMMLKGCTHRATGALRL